MIAILNDFGHHSKLRGVSVHLQEVSLTEIVLRLDLVCVLLEYDGLQYCV